MSPAASNAPHRQLPIVSETDDKTTAAQRRLILAGWNAWAIPSLILMLLSRPFWAQTAALALVSLPGVFILVMMDSKARLRRLPQSLRSRTGVLLGLWLAALLTTVAIVASPGCASFVGNLLLLTICFLWFSAPDADRLRLYLARFLIVNVTFCLAAAFGEFALRLPSLTKRVQPEAQVHAAKLTRNDYDATTWTEWRGRKFRSRHLDTPKSTNTLRILTLGDSFTWGQNIASTDDIWPYVLEREMNSTNRPVEVVNLALPGNTTVNEREFLERFGWDLQPDLIVVQYLINDPLPSSPNFQRETIEWMKDPGTPLAISPELHARLVRKSYLYSALNARASALQRKLFNLRDMDYFDLHADEFEHWQKTRRAFESFARHAKKRNIPILFVMFPIFERDTKLSREDYPYTPLHAKLGKEIKSHNMPFLDLLPIYAAENPDANVWQVNPADSHPSVKAHEIAARAVAKEIERIQ